MDKKAYVAPTVEVVKLDNIYTGWYDNRDKGGYGIRPGYFFQPGPDGGKYIKKD